ncbi:hypothetical protein DFQ29_006436, partial [Apophysomyces sp. BC1021]
MDPLEKIINERSERIKAIAASKFAAALSSSKDAILAEINEYDHNKVVQKAHTTRLFEIRTWSLYAGFISSLYEDKRDQKIPYKTENPTDPENYNL